MCAEAPEVMKRLCGRDRLADILVTNAPAPFLEFADQIRLLYLSSCPDPRLKAQFSSCRMVRKPFTPADLVHAVAELEAVRRTSGRKAAPAMCLPNRDVGQFVQACLGQLAHGLC
jgi:hypothetical protein